MSTSQITRTQVAELLRTFGHLTREKAYAQAAEEFPHGAVMVMRDGKITVVPNPADCCTICGQVLPCDWTVAHAYTEGIEITYSPADATVRGHVATWTATDTESGYVSRYHESPACARSCMLAHRERVHVPA